MSVKKFNLKLKIDLNFKELLNQMSNSIWTFRKNETFYFASKHWKKKTLIYTKKSNPLSPQQHTPELIKFALESMTWTLNDCETKRRQLIIDYYYYYYYYVLSMVVVMFQFVLVYIHICRTFEQSSEASWHNSTHLISRVLPNVHTLAKWHHLKLKHRLLWQGKHNTEN
mgnify:CR=1 FL=1